MFFHCSATQTLWPCMNRGTHAIGICGVHGPTRAAFAAAIHVPSPNHGRREACGDRFRKRKYKQFDAGLGAFTIWRHLDVFNGQCMDCVRTGRDSGCGEEKEWKNSKIIK